MSETPDPSAPSGAVYLVVSQRVKDPQVWASTMRAAGEHRRAAGAVGDPLLLHDPDHPGHVLAVVAFTDEAAAQAWRSRPGGRDQMLAAGVDLESVEVSVLQGIPK